MLDEFLVSPWLMTIVCLLSALLYILRYRKNHDYMELGMSLPRILLFLTYLWIALIPSTPIETTRLMGRDGLLLLLLTDVLYNVLCMWVGRKKKHANWIQ